MDVARGAKIAFVACVGIFGLLTGIDNIIDYPTNYAVVQHILSMDAVPASSPLIGRAITNPSLHAAFYWVIIGSEILFGSLCIFGALRLATAFRAPAAAFNAAKGPAALGLALGFALYFFAFLIIGGEWFQMWQAGEWNMQQAAFRFIGSIGLVLVFLCLPDGD